MPEGQKTEKATPKKRRDERKKGNVFMSKDAVAVVSLLGTFATLWLLTTMFAEETARFMALCFDVMGQEYREVGSLSGELSVQGIVSIAKTVGPVVLVGLGLLFMLTVPFSEYLINAERMMLDSLHEILLLSAGGG